MSTTWEVDSLSKALFGKTRQAVMSLLYGHADEAYYLRQIARATGISLGPVQRELKQLSDAGIINRTVQGHQVYFQANQDCPIFTELKGLLTKTAGVGDVLRSALTSLSNRIDLAFVYGSVARGNEGRQSDIDLLVVGSIEFADIVSALQGAQKMLEREINPTVYPPVEFASKLKSGDHFLKDVSKNTKFFIIGSDHDFKKLAEK